MAIKPLRFRGDSLVALREFSADARQDAGFQLDRVQRGLEPDDWKPMATVGAGAKELRIWDETGAFRVIYLAKLAEAVYVLHCFQKKTEQTSEKDIQLARKRYRDVDEGEAEMSKQRQFESVWDAIEDTPQQAASMRARSELLIALQEWVRIQNKTQVEAAKILGVTQPRMSDLARGRIHLFSLDALMDMATIAGLSPHIAVKRPKAPKKQTPAEAQAV